MKNLKVSYGSELHQKLLGRLLRRFNLAYSAIQRRVQDWNDADRLFTAYLPRSQDDALRYQDRRVTGRQYPFTVEIPYSYAVLMAAHTYWCTIFLSRTPVFQYMARSGDVPPDAPMALEAVIDYQLSYSHSLPALYYWLLDAPRYGYGVIGCYWDVRYANIATLEDNSEVVSTLLGLPKRQKVVRRELAFEGNVLFNVRPHDFLFDPRVPVWRFQDGEFCGRLVSVTLSDLLEGMEQGRYQNIEVVQRHGAAKIEHIGSSGASLDRLPSGDPRQVLPEQQFANMAIDDADIGSVEVIELFVKVSPKLWGLGSSTAPEIWKFSIANRSVIIEAAPFDAMHNRFPFFVLPYEFEPYAASPRGMLDITKDLNYIISWLVNSHIQNVRRAINNQFVVNPAMVRMEDFAQGGEGLLIRLRPEAYSGDVRQAIMQLPVTDVTRTHLQDIQLIEGIIQRVTGVNDNIMGQLDPRGRKTATEVRAASTFGINRLKTQAEFFSAIGFTPLARILVQNTQQYLSATRRYKVPGKEDFIEVSPEKILGEFDFVPVDGTMPVDRYAQASLWTQILQQLMSNPQTAGQFDIMGIIVHIAKLLGVKSLEQFRIQVKPDEEVLGGDNVRLGELLQKGAGSEATGVEPATPSAGLGPNSATIG